MFQVYPYRVPSIPLSTIIIKFLRSYLIVESRDPSEFDNQPFGCLWTATHRTPQEDLWVWVKHRNRIYDDGVGQARGSLFYTDKEIFPQLTSIAGD